MPDLNDGLTSHQLTTNHFGFSAERIDTLDASEYTLVTLVVDTSSSTLEFRKEMREVVEKIVQACRKSPRADNLMFRVAEFGSHFSEVHGFKKLNSVQAQDYNNQFQSGGMTALFDAIENTLQATASYGKSLADNDFQTNGILFVVTDGEDNSSKATVNSVKEAFKAVLKTEALESMVSVLIGVNADPQLDNTLQNLKDNLGFTQYVNMGNATPGNLAKLAEFVSKSISSQSQSLGSGGPSQALVF